MGDLLYIGVLVLAYLALKVMPQDWLTRIIMTVLGKTGLEKVGQKALSAQPDRLTLDPKPGAVRPEAGTALSSLERRGYTRSGSFAIREMPGVLVHFLAKPADGVVGVVYEHPKAGVWCDMYSRYPDGTSFTTTSAKAGGSIEQRPGHATIRAPGQPPALLHMRHMSERPAGQPESIGADQAPRVFVSAYEESMAWMKGRGLSAQEVRGAAFEKVG